MKRSVGALGILGLFYAVALPAASAGVLWQPDLSKCKLEGVNGLYIQAINGQTKSDPDSEEIGIAPFVINCDETSKAFGWLDGGNGDSTADGGSDLDEDADERTAIGLLLTGNPQWADVSIQAKMNVLDQNTGTMALVLRAAPKSKVSDPNTWYEFRYTSGNSVVLASEARDGIKQPTDTSTNPDGSVAGVSLRIMKVVNGKWTLLAEQNRAGSPVYIPALNRLGIDHDVNKDPDDDGNGDDALVGAYFRFVAKGELLTGYVSMDGQNFQQVLQATDGELKAGLVGFSQYDYRALYKEIRVEDAP
jgi:hypothetical protein